ncbi:MAG: hypothetical protein NTV68_14475 [Methanomicrobiales archaeon]|nr:hypothetical protein [Methanomicrobiales archaeon]
MLSKERSVSNLYIIPAGVFSPPSLSYPAPPSTIATPAGIVTTTTPPVNASSPVPGIGVPVMTANTPASGPDTRSSLDVLRGAPFTINGTVDNLSITKVQVWVLNGTITTTSIPVMPDRTFQVTFDSRETDALSRTYASAVLVQYPLPPDHFAISWDSNRSEAIETKSGNTTPLLAHLKDPGMYPTTQVDYLEQGIRAAGDSAKIYFLNGVDGWITIDPISPVKPGTLVVRGNTSLSVGTPLAISVGTVNMHPTPKIYDWSHEIADEGTTLVDHGPFGVNRYSVIIDTSHLNTGKYLVSVESRDENLQADADSIVELIAEIPANPAQGNYINWSRLALPDLVVNKSLTPVMLEGELRIVPHGTPAGNNELPYGSIIVCAPDAVCRIFDPSGVQTLAVYNSNEARIMEVPNGAMIDSGTVGNVTFIRLNGDVILTKIDEYPRSP